MQGNHCAIHRPGVGSWQQTLAAGLVSLHSTADELQHEKLEGNGTGLCLQTSNTNNRWGLVLVKGHLQLQLSISAVVFYVSHYPFCPASLAHALEMDCAGRHLSAIPQWETEACLHFAHGPFVYKRRLQVSLHQLDIGLLFSVMVLGRAEPLALSIFPLLPS